MPANSFYPGEALPNGWNWHGDYIVDDNGNFMGKGDQVKRPTWFPRQGEQQPGQGPMLPSPVQQLPPGSDTPTSPGGPWIPGSPWPPGQQPSPTPPPAAPSPPVGSFPMLPPVGGGGYSPTFPQKNTLAQAFRPQPAQTQSQQPGMISSGTRRSPLGGMRAGQRQSQYGPMTKSPFSYGVRR
jgi:hypothetical protein